MLLDTKKESENLPVWGLKQPFVTINAVLNQKGKREIPFQEMRYLSHPQISLQALAP